MLFLKVSWFLGSTVRDLFLFSPDLFLILLNTVMIYNIRNWSNYRTQSQKEKRPVLMLIQEEIETWMPNVCKQIWKLYILGIKYESRTSLHAVKSKRQSGSVLMFCPYYFRNGWPRHFVLMFCRIASLALLLACS